jgi:hypothetical protein
VVAGVSVDPVHDAVPVPHAVPAAGKTHAPVASHAVAPHVPPIVGQAMVQQWPLPDVPHAPPTHWSLAAQTAPGASWGTHAAALQ